MSHSIALSMRYLTKHYPSGNHESYNALASSWFDFLFKAFPLSSYIALPAHLQSCKNILKNHTIDALILSGGDDIGLHIQRDETELELLHWAEKNHIPTLGVCRGMQLINNYYGGSLEKDTKHIATRHSLTFDPTYTDIFSKEINSYHGHSISVTSLAPALTPLAFADNNVYVEAYKHKDKDIYGIMWHPEREENVRPSDIALIQKILTKI